MGKLDDKWTRNILFFNSDKQVGQYKNGLANGRVAYYFSDGNIFTGFFIDGVPLGYGKIYYSNCDVYTGEWLNKERHGLGKWNFKMGILILAI